MNSQQVLAVIRLAIVILVLLAIVRNRCLPGNFRYAMPFIVWMIHAVVYLSSYLVMSYLGRVSASVFNTWSASLQIHGFLTVLMVEAARYYRQKAKVSGGKLEC